MTSTRFIYKFAATPEFYCPDADFSAQARRISATLRKTLHSTPSGTYNVSGGSAPLPGSISDKAQLSVDGTIKVTGKSPSITLSARLKSPKAPKMRITATLKDIQWTNTLKPLVLAGQADRHIYGIKFINCKVGDKKLTSTADANFDIRYADDISFE